jgi:hypothetical protein
MECDITLAFTGIEWLNQMAQPNKWNLTDEDVAKLLGGLPPHVYRELRDRVDAGQHIEVTEDVLLRVSLLLGISKGLQCIAPHERDELGYAWFNQPNTGSLFDGQSMKDFLLQAQTIESFYNARDYLMAHSEP